MANWGAKRAGRHVALRSPDGLTLYMSAREARILAAQLLDAADESLEMRRQDAMDAEDAA